METTIRTIAAFDFDGTLTTRDTLPLFIIHSRGWRRFAYGMFKLSPMLCCYLLGFISNEEAKQWIFAYFFKGMPYNDFKLYGKTFSEKIEKHLKTKVLNLLKSHKKHGHAIYIISASIEEWIQPWAKRHEVDKVIATQIEVDKDGTLTGRFRSPNCFGQEKIRRLLEKEPDRDSYYLYAYGDSRGDIPLLEFANEGEMIPSFLV